MNGEITLLITLDVFFRSLTFGDWLNLVGLVVTVIGFAVAIVNIRRTRSVAQAARDAAVRTQHELVRLDTVMEFSSAMTLMEEIKRHHRGGYWHILPDRYATLRKKLIAIKTSSGQLTDEQLALLQSAIQDFKVMEGKVERSLAKAGVPPDPAKLNRIVSDQIDSLNQLLIEIKHEFEGN